MKRGTPQHPKTLELASELDVPRYVAVGLLEELWHWAGAYAKRGDVGRFTDGAISRGIGWDGDAAKLINALRKVRWLDAHPEHRLVIHDWHDHADDAVHMALARAGERFATNNSIPRMTRIAQQERERLLATYEREPAPASNAVHDAPPAHNAQREHSVATANGHPMHAVATNSTRGEHCLSLGLGLSQSQTPAAAAAAAKIATGGGEGRATGTPADSGISSPAPPGVHTALVEFFTTSWRQKFGTNYRFQSGKDGTAAREVLAGCAGQLGRAQQIVRDYLADTDDFISGKGDTLAMLASQLNRYLAGAHRKGRSNGQGRLAGDVPKRRFGRHED